jgi:chromate reductase
VTSIGLLSGSLGRDSLTSALLRVAADAARSRAEVSAVTTLHLSGVPMFSRDLEGENEPHAVTHLKTSVASCDCLLIATPDYNGYPSGLLKNALDWLSRPPDSSPFSGALVATMSVASEPHGGAPAQFHLRQILINMGCVLVDAELVAVGCLARTETSSLDAVENGVTRSVRALVAELIAASVRRRSSFG